MNVTYLKWAGTVFLLLGVTLNTLNTPEYQQYVYPFNLYLSLFGSGMLFAISRIQKDYPYMLLNGVVLALYILGILNSIFPFHTL